ncbi:MAG TPA: hypothetical protein PKC30_08370 [Saprospiraceae bacterium]|nr:hypothetical protein [Saprospiraceae bacterium]
MNLAYFQKFTNAENPFNHVSGLSYFGDCLMICENEVLTHPNLFLPGSILEWCDDHTMVMDAPWLH